MKIKKIGVYAILFLFVFSSLTLVSAAVDDGWGSTGVLSQILRYIFGQTTDITSNEVSAIIITIAIWILIVFTFADIIKTFSTFSPLVAWSAGFAFALIAANLNWIVHILSWFVGIAAFLGGLAVIAGIVGAFIVFIGVNLGLTFLKPFIQGRKEMAKDTEAMMGAMRAATGIKVAGKIAQGAEDTAEGER